MRLNWETDMTYQGVARLPLMKIGATSLNFNQRGLALAPDGKSIFLIGSQQDAVTTGQQVAEFNLPLPKVVSILSNAPHATLKQPFIEPSEGHFREASVPGTHTDIGGICCIDDKLYVNYFAYYDSNSTQNLHLISRPSDLSITGQVNGPMKLNCNPGVLKGDGTTKTLNSTRFLNGYTFKVPNGYWIGSAQANIVSGGPNGPGFFQWDIDNSKAHPFSYYPALHPLGAWNTQSDVWNSTTAVSGAAYVDGTDTILIAANMGIGSWAYAVGGEFPPVNSTDFWVYDPVYKAHGPHAFPYENHLMAYDINEIMNTKTPWTVKPYAIWKLDLPFTRMVKLADGSKVEKPQVGLSGGIGYDKDSKRVVIMQGLSDSDGPILHFFGVN